jgi:hypothetical protein
MRTSGARDLRSRGNAFVGCVTIIFAMSTSVLYTDCPECGSEITVDLGTSHRPFSDNEKMMYRLVCDSCGLSFDAHFEDLLPRENFDH